MGTVAQAVDRSAVKGEPCRHNPVLLLPGKSCIRLVHKTIGTICGLSACVKNFQWNPRWQRTPVTQKVIFCFLSQSWIEAAAWCWRTLLLDKMQWAQKHRQSHAVVLGDCSAILITFQPEIYILQIEVPPCSSTANDICHNSLFKNLYRNGKSLLYFSLEMTATLHRMKQFLYVVCGAFRTPKRWNNPYC